MLTLTNCVLYIGRYIMPQNGVTSRGVIDQDLVHDLLKCSALQHTSIV